MKESVLITGVPGTGTADVQDWIIGWKDWFDAEVKKYNPIIVDANFELKAVVEKIINFIESSLIKLIHSPKIQETRFFISFRMMRRVKI